MRRSFAAMAQTEYEEQRLLNLASDGWVVKIWAEREYWRAEIESATADAGKPECMSGCSVSREWTRDRAWKLMLTFCEDFAAMCETD